MIRLARHITAAALFALPFVSAPAMAGAPMVNTQAPGYYRHMLGDFEVTVLLDGTIKLPVLKLLTNARPEQLLAALKRGYLREEVETSVNAYLVNTGAKLVLIDTGTGALFGPGAQLLDNLRAAGYTPEQVDEIYITHMHGDHVGGLMAGSNRAFPNATLRIDKADTDFWLSEAVMNRAPESVRDFFKGAKQGSKTSLRVTTKLETWAKFDVKNSSDLANEIVQDIERQIGVKLQKT